MSGMGGTALLMILAFEFVNLFGLLLTTNVEYVILGS